MTGNIDLYRQRKPLQGGASYNFDVINANTLQAFYYAVDHWKVHIISMSFGFPKSVKVIRDAIEYARGKQVLVFASASNSGGNRDIAWPAKHDSVICINATDHLGNPYGGNPTYVKDRENLSILGESVAGWKPYDEVKAAEECRSGTSSATPIAAGVAAIVLCILHHCKTEYVAQRDDKERNKRAEAYDEGLESIRQASGMRKVLKMIAGDKERHGYSFIAPWEHLNFTDAHHKHTLVENILRRLER